LSARLAVVDDDRAFTGFLSTFLKTRGYTVDSYNSGRALLEGLKGGATPNVILLDVAMPDVDGLETLRAIRQQRPTSQVIMLSGRQAPATIVEAVRLGAADYVLKPGDPEGMGEMALEAAIRNALERESLSAEVARLSASVAEDPTGAQASWSSGSAMDAVTAMVDRVADSDISVLLRGESGVGKDVIARELHRRSPRRARTFVKVNCAALPAELLESELFGHEKGSFTGAGNQRIGKFEFAHQGTLMLDEIGDMSPTLQAKLLHVLQDREFTRVGGNRPIDVDVRVLAATNQNLEAMMRAGTFREDLYYRLQVIEIHSPPLRERREEIPSLVEFFLAKYSRMYHRPAPKPSPTLSELLFNHQWPGNIRELENVIKRYVILQEESLIVAELERPRVAPPPPPAPAAAPAVAETPAVSAEGSVPASAAAALGSSGGVGVAETEPATESPDGIDLQELARAAAMQAEREAISRALERFRWNRRKVAEYLNVSYKTLLNKMKECGITELPGA
jgi:two-component system response regulator AtoC